MNKQIEKLNREYAKLNKEYVALDNANDYLTSAYELDKNYERMDEIQERIAEIANELEKSRGIMDIYTDNGYKDRAEYLSALSEDYGVDIEIVQCLADLLGESEDFDGLVSALEDV